MADNAPAQRPTINTANPTRDDIQRGLARLATRPAASTASTLFYDRNGRLIPNVHIMQTIRERFGTGAIPWNGATKKEVFIATLEHFEVAKGNVEADEYLPDQLKEIKPRIQKARASILMAMNEINLDIAKAENRDVADAALLEVRGCSSLLN